MQPRVWCFGLCAALSGLPLLGNEAEMTIASQSIAVSPATAVDAGELTFSLSFTADVDADGNVASLNNEWVAASGTIGYATTFLLENNDLAFSTQGILQVDIPLSGDTNLNFITDFFEVNRAVSAETTGVIQIENVNRTVSAVWSRAAGETTGHVKLTFSSPSQQIAEITFDHVFEIFEYTGKLIYTPAAAMGGEVDASVDLSRVGAEGKFVGPFPLTLTNPSGLERHEAQWAGPNHQTFDVLGSFDIEGVELTLDRVGARPWYTGSLFFLDGNPATPFEDEYDLWDIFIRDLNDADHDGNPDLSDPAQLVTIPVLTVVPTSTGLQMTIEGAVGSRINVEQRDTLGSGGWTTVQTVQLDTTPKTISLNLPTGNVSFWRASQP